MMIRRTLPRVVVVAAAAGLLLTVVSGAQAQPGGGGADRAEAGNAGQRTAARADSIPGGGRFGIPAPKSVSPNDVQQAYGTSLKDSGTTISRAKVGVNLPDSYTVGYVRGCSAGDVDFGDGSPVHQLQTCCPTAFLDADCAPDEIVHFPATSDGGQNAWNWYRFDAPFWVSSPAGSPLRYGTFPQVQVAALAFGSIPVTATVHLSQTLTRSGRVTPLSFEQLTLTATNAGTTVSGYPTASPYDSAAMDWYVKLAGPVDVRLDQVKIDGRPVDVGRACRTRSPAQVSYAAPRGWYSASADPNDLVGRPGGFLPLAGEHTGQADGNISIPAFTGCVSGREDLSPLLTSMASGARNHLLIKLADSFRTCKFSDAEVGGADCPAYPGDPRQRGGEAEAARAVAVPQAARKKIVANVTRSLRRLPHGTRTALLETLPADVRISSTSRGR